MNDIVVFFKENYDSIQRVYTELVANYVPRCLFFAFAKMGDYGGVDPAILLCHATENYYKLVLMLI